MVYFDDVSTSAGGKAIPLKTYGSEVNYIRVRSAEIPQCDPRMAGTVWTLNAR